MTTSKTNNRYTIQIKWIARDQFPSSSIHNHYQPQAKMVRQSQAVKQKLLPSAWKLGLEILDWPLQGTEHRCDDTHYQECPISGHLPTSLHKVTQNSLLKWNLTLKKSSHSSTVPWVLKVISSTLNFTQNETLWGATTSLTVPGNSRSVMTPSMHYKSLMFVGEQPKNIVKMRDGSFVSVRCITTLFWSHYWLSIATLILWILLWSQPQITG